MSWCGGGEIRPTPGVACRVLAIHGHTLLPGSWPPSPGFAPWAILICRSSALTRYSLVTPNRPLATCLTAERRAGSCSRSTSSPPSPVLDLPPSRFIAMASVSCASAEIEPYDMAPVANRLTISLAGSTSSIGTGGRTPVRSRNSPRSEPACGGQLVDLGGVLAEDVVLPAAGGVLQQEDRLRVEQVQLALAAPLVLAADLQPAVARARPGWPGRPARAGRPPRRAISASPMPPIRLGVPVK